MRPATLLSLILLAAVATVSALDISPYLAANESNASIDKEFFTLNHTVYYVVSINGDPSFLVKGDAFVTDQAEITGTLKSYYLLKYTLDPDDVSALRTAFLSYNDSRNNGEGRFPGKEEYICRKVLYLDKVPCTDVSNCNQTALYLCAYQNNVAPGMCNDYRPLISPVASFAKASFGTDAILADVFDKLDGMNSENAAAYVAQMKANVPTLRTYASNLESTLFRMPLPGTTCRDCMGICPFIDVDTNQLDTADTILASMSKKVSPFSSYSQTAGRIYNNTNRRVEDSANSQVRAYYTEALYNPLRVQASDVKNRTSAALALVDNSTVKMKLAQLTAMEGDIESQINSNNFTSINATLSDYNKSIRALNASIGPLMAVYNNVSDKYKSATVYLFLAEGRTLSPDDLSTLNVLRQQKIILDQQFKAGLTATQYNDLLANYTALVDKEQALAGKKGAEQALYMFTGMANKLVDALDTLLVQTRPLTYNERVQFSSYLPVGLSLLLFSSFSSMILFLFLIYYAISSKPMNKVLFVMLAMFLVALIGLVSIGIFLSLDKSLNRLDYGDFIDIAKYTKNAVIAVQLNGADDATLASMKACASSISDAFTADKVTPIVYTLRGEDCVGNGTAVKDCLDKNAKPMVMLNASVISSSTYSGLLTKQATVSGDHTYYDVCPLASALKGS